MKRIALATLLALVATNCWGELNPNEKALFTAIKENNYGKVTSLLREKKNIDINKKNKKGVTPIHPASSGGNTNIVKILIEKGADVDSPADKDGHTPLHDAAFEGHLEIVKLLLEKGANLNPKDNNKETPLHYASRAGRKKIVKHLIENGANIEEKNDKGATPIHLASDWGELETVILLIKSGANIDSPANDGHTALHDALRNRHPKTAKFLIKNGADVNKKGKNDVTPLHEAAVEGYPITVKLLLKNGATVDAKDQSGETALYKVLTTYIKEDETIKKPSPEEITRSEETIKKIAETLINNGASIWQEENEVSPLFIATALQEKSEEEEEPQKVFKIKDFIIEKFGNKKFAELCSAEKKTIEPKGDKENCSLCIEKMENNIKILKCGHIYHAACIKEVFTKTAPNKGKIVCPICRGEITGIYDYKAPQ